MLLSAAVSSRRARLLKPYGKNVGSRNNGRDVIDLVHRVLVIRVLLEPQRKDVADVCMRVSSLTSRPSTNATHTFQACCSSSTDHIKYQRHRIHKVAI